mmetsp:Transcript_6762/g.10439  ORF Transcript_6762/g.10439 Transcript_6762/m.10439 type:complete len:129 (-) Transcript_6762:458-844(-)
MREQVGNGTHLVVPVVSAVAPAHALATSGVMQKVLDSHLGLIAAPFRFGVAAGTLRIVASKESFSDGCRKERGDDRPRLDDACRYNLHSTFNNEIVQKEHCSGNEKDDDTGDCINQRFVRDKVIFKIL